MDYVIGVVAGGAFIIWLMFWAVCATVGQFVEQLEMWERVGLMGK